jgi:hypothetical protein
MGSLLPNCGLSRRNSRRTLARTHGCGTADAPGREWGLTSVQILNFLYEPEEQ